MSRTVCRIDQLHRRYAAAPAVIDSLDLEIAAGEIVAVLGASGSGKSTLLNLVGQMDQPDGGTITYFDAATGRVDARGWNDDQRTAFRCRHIGFVFQAYNLLPTLTLRENILLPLELNGNRDTAHAERLIERLDLGAAAARYPDAASGGEQQRAAIGRALVHEPLLVIADEPTGNLDPATAARVIALFESCARELGASVLLATHSTRVAACADRRLALERGRLQAVSP